jgi:hypothetical protein
VLKFDACPLFWCSAGRSADPGARPSVTLGGWPSKELMVFDGRSDRCDDNCDSLCIRLEMLRNLYAVFSNGGMEVGSH